MIEVVIAVLGAVVGASALVVSIAGHRHNVRQAARLAERERRVEDREREADQREQLIQSSMLHVAMVSRPSALADGYTRWHLDAVNTSNQPLVQVAVRYDGVRLDGREVLPAGGALTVDLPTTSVAGSPPSPLLCSVEFTDTSGRRWRRLATGQLQPWAPGTDGEEHWHAPVAPIVSPFTAGWGAPEPGGTPPVRGPARPRRLSRRLWAGDEGELPLRTALALGLAGAVLITAYLIVRYVG
ncbi:hypothetical protein RM704_27910 [Streptomyces sp. DSM 3412]|uniref:Uncharacterized protein n=1 Tax=Streptomyces gottesmaniae TaxID=3075518 RepID=A0ABU2Z3T4_9ACTN|nr:hypothetical protein [Streptomyces sp. DSM 3412]MDT0571242.1 hypothetical protein [Streptomyces sp. DSM 3412]